MNNGLEIKWCNKGGRYKPVAEFRTINDREHPRLDGSCRDCMNAARNQRRDADREKARNYEREWYRANTDKVRDRARERYQREKERHPDKNREYVKNYYHTNEEYRRRQLTSAQRRYAEKRAERLAYQKQYAQENPEKVRERKRAYKIRRRGARGEFTPEQWLAKCEFWGWRCYLCGEGLTAESAQREHRVPLSRGGSNWLANVAPACACCNNKKNAKTEREYRDLSERQTDTKAAHLTMCKVAVGL